ncbi:hypothetical protein CR152_08515 [Massilia violaceinigra]|uniref:Uncharacterized protein n=1 Tax=Massilia violaceinigra TaxID=2045208 RepID=A0A2D2DHV6_9BURK|nr:hypothetical protein CR152_08515 [Massilia violaceinigra]
MGMGTATTVNINLDNISQNIICPGQLFRAGNAGIEAEEGKGVRCSGGSAEKHPATSAAGEI